MYGTRPDEGCLGCVIGHKAIADAINGIRGISSALAKEVERDENEVRKKLMHFFVRARCPLRNFLQ